MSRTRRSGYRRRKQEREAQGFGRNVPWAPGDLPGDAREFWPPKGSWPTEADVARIVSATEEQPDARLAVLSGLRRWSEPASSQMLVALGSIIVSIVAIAIASSTFNSALYFGVLGVGVAYIILALFGFGLAMRMDERRRMALVWLCAIEDAVAESKASKPKRLWNVLAAKLAR